MMDSCRIIDLSVALEHKAPSEPLKPRIRYLNHKLGYWQMRWLFGVKKGQLKRSAGLGWAMEKISAITHTGTHVDAPYHYGPRSGGKAALTIDEVPLEWCIGPGVKLDVRHLSDGDEITVSELEKAFDAIDYQLQGNEIVLIQTGADQYIDSKQYFQQPGLGEKGSIRMIGIDAYTLDRPFHSMKQDFKVTGDPNVLWPAHFVGLETPYCQIEKLTNLDQIPMNHGFQVSCLPVKIAKASAGWCRAVALVPV